MASITSAEVQCSTYIKARVVVDYSGTSATAHIQYIHTYGGYTGYTGSFNYGAGSSSASGSWNNETVSTSWTEKMSIAFPISTDGGTYRIWCSGYSYNDFEVDVTIPAQYTDPSTPSVTVKSKTHNSVTFGVSISSYGNPSGESGRYIEAALLQNNSYDGSTSNRRRWQVAYRTTSANIKVDNNGSYNGGSDGLGLTITGNSRYYYGGYATNTKRTKSVVTGQVYTPCPPLSALALSSQAYSAYDKVTATMSYTRQSDGGAQTRTGYYRYSTDNGATWSSWVSFGTVSNTTGTFTIPNLPTDKTVLVQAKLTTSNGGDSETKQTSFSTKTTHTAPNFSNFVYEDTSADAIALTNNNQIFIQGQSQPKVTISTANKATANDGASITSYTASLNAESIQIAYSASVAVSGTFNANRPTASGTLALSVAANDSLNLSKAVSKNVTVIPWTEPTLEATATRTNNFENSTTIKIKGTYSPLEINSVVKNTLATAYRFKKKSASSWDTTTPGADADGWVSVANTISGANYSVADFVLSFDNEYQWDIEVRAVDEFATTTVAIELSVGKPIMFISKNKKVSINRKPTNYNADLDVEGKVCAEDSVLS